MCEDDGVQDTLTGCKLDCTTLTQFLNNDVMRIYNQMNILNKRTTTKVISLGESDMAHWHYLVKVGYVILASILLFIKHCSKAAIYSKMHINERLTAEYNNKDCIKLQFFIPSVSVKHDNCFDQKCR